MKPFLPCALAVLVFVGARRPLVAAPASTPAPNKAPATAIRWKPEADMGGQLYPSLIVATANRRPEPDADHPASPDLLGDRFGLLGISARATQPNTRFRVTIRDNEILNASTWTGTLPQANHTYYIAPPIAYKYDALRHVRQQRPLSVQFDVEINNQPAGTQTQTVTLRSINDCPYAVEPSDATPAEREGKRPTRRDDAEGKDPAMHGASDSALGWMFAAYVNEDHPIIDTVLNEALHTGVLASVDGYQDGKPSAVLRQAFAVWTVLQDRGIRYSDVSTTPGRDEAVKSQDVRFVDESLRHQQANCVDGSVLFASVLRKMGLAPFLVVVPHHMYVGVALSPREDSEAVACIETTLLGASEVDDSLWPPAALAALERSLDGATRGRAAWRTFKTAVSYATGVFAHDKDKFEDDDNTDYQVIDIARAREEGVMPIPFDRADGPSELPGGPTHPDTTGQDSSARPLPTPFVRPSPDDLPAPRSTPRPAATPAAAPAATPKRTPGGGGSALDAAEAAGTSTPAGRSPTPAKPTPRRVPSPTPSATPQASRSKDDYDGFFHDRH